MKVFAVVGSPASFATCLVSQVSSTIFANTLKLCHFLRGRNEVSHLRHQQLQC